MGVVYFSASIAWVMRLFLKSYYVEKYKLQLPFIRMSSAEEYKIWVVSLILKT
jgi:hypothetical protein